MLLERSGGLPYDRAAVAALAALPPFEPYRHLRRKAAVRLQVDLEFKPRPAGYQPAVSNALPADPPANSFAIVNALNAEQRPAAERGGLLFIQAVAQHAVVLPEEVRTGAVDGLVVEAVAGLSGRVYGLRIQQSLSPTGCRRKRPGLGQPLRIQQSLSPTCDSAALAAVRRLPLLTPGQYRGQTVAMRLFIPLKFWGPNHLYEPNSAPYPATFAGPDLDAYIVAHLRVPDSLETVPQPRTVALRLTLDRAGQVQTVAVTRPALPALDREAVRFAQALPAWQPARDADNQPVRSEVLLELRFPPLSVAPTPAPAAARPGLVLEDVGYTYVEQIPTLPGGNSTRKALVDAAQTRFRYPEAERATGVITVRFVVDPQGRAGAARILQGLSDATDAAALAAVAALPQFGPGRQNGQAVTVIFTVPVTVAPRTKG